MARKVEKLVPLTLEKLRTIYIRAEAGKLEAVAATVDQEAMINEEDTRWTAEVWDGASSVNGAAPSLLVRKFNIKPGSFCYLVKDDQGKAVIFQPFKPGVGGSQPMTREEAEDYSQDARQNAVNSRALNRITRAINAGLKAD
jgi:bifunctional DNA-binding transcriptional regulator/antitoxin component of YhaV-PrlF toxin-antitoxin module